MAITSRAADTLRLTFLAPQAKMGRLIEGPKLQLSTSFPIKYPRSVEAKPILPVSEMDGKKAARAATILARAARSFSSAANMSGRVTISSEGNPAAITIPFFWSASVSGTVSPTGTGPPQSTARKFSLCASAKRRLANRSEEHTSAFQSLMRHSYAVYCLKKKNIHTRDRHELKEHRKSNTSHNIHNK